MSGYRIRTGRALKGAVEHLFASDVFQDVDWDWPSLVRKIDLFAPKIAEEVRQQIQFEDDEEHRRSAENDRRYELERPVREWVGRSNWPPSNSSGGGGIGYAVGRARLSAGVTAYVDAYLAEQGRFPTGPHEIDQSIGDADRAAQCRAKGDGIGAAIVAPGRIKLTVQFPNE